MILPFGQNIPNLFIFEDIESGMDFTLRDSYNNENYELEDFIFDKQESLMDLFKTKSFNDLYNKRETLNKQQAEKEKYSDEEITPEYFSLKKIKDLIIQKSPLETFKELDDTILLDTNLENVESNINDQILLGKKRKKKEKLKLNSNKEADIAIIEKKFITLKKHDKYCGDNIIKKIKFKLLEAFLKYVNKVINETFDKEKLMEYNKILRPFNIKKEKCEDILKIIDYRYIDKLNKKRDLSLLHMPFKEIFSKNISPKYLKLRQDSNKLIIEKLLKEEKENSDITFVLNIKFKDWIDIFTYKKEFDSLINLKEERIDNLVQYFEYADKLIYDIYRINQNDNYLLYFLIHLFNYERWFCLKRGRTRMRKEK